MITTPRLLLRSPLPGDERNLFPITSDPEVAKYMQHRAHRDPSETAQYLLAAVKLITQHKGYLWVIEHQETGQVIGALSAAYDHGPHSVIFGGYLGPTSWRNGYGVEAAAAVLDHLKSKPHIYRIHCQTDVQNEPCIRLVKKLGLVQEGRLARAWPGHDGQEPRDVYSFSWTC